MKHKIITADWKDIDELITGFEKAIKMLGGKLYNLPCCEGTDTYGFIVSDQKLTKEQIKKLDPFYEDDE